MIVWWAISGWLAAIVVFVALRRPRREEETPPATDPSVERRSKAFDGRRILRAILSADGRLLEVNRAWHAQTGWLTRDLEGRDVRALLPDEEVPGFHATLANLNVPGMNRSIELRVRHRDGTTRLLDATLENIEGTLLLTAKDATQDQASRIAEQRSQAQALDEARIQRSLVQELSRSLRRPMQGITGAVGLLADGGIDERQRELIHIIASSNAQLGETLDEATHLSNVMAGKAQKTVTPYLVRGCLDTAVATVAASANSRGVRIAVDATDAEPTSIGDEWAVRQVIVQMLETVVATTRSPEILLRARQAGHQMFIDIVDEEHAGIRHPTITPGQRLLEAASGQIHYPGDRTVVSLCVPHERVPSEVLSPGSLEPIEGTVGVAARGPLSRDAWQRLLQSWGLRARRLEHPRQLAPDALDALLIEDDQPIAWLDAVRHDVPVVAIQSQRAIRDPRVGKVVPVPGQPSEIHAALSEVLAGKKPRPQVPGDLASRFPLRIVVAEDDQFNRQIVRLLLQRMGYNPVVVADGKEVLPLLYEPPVDLVLMDIEMEGLDGLATTRLMRQNRGIAQPVVVAMTAHAETGFRKGAEDAGIDEIINKPVPVDRLVSIIEWAHRRISIGRREPQTEP